MSDALYAAIAQEEARKIAGPVAQERATEVAAEVAERTTVAQLPAKVADYLRANPPRPGEPGLTWQGRWQASATYSPGDAVEIEGSSYVAIRTTHDERPPSSPSWELLARKGDPGPPGVMGPGGGGGPGVTPTLAEVLAQGNDTDSQEIVSKVGGFDRVKITPAADGSSLQITNLDATGSDALAGLLLTGGGPTELWAQNPANVAEFMGQLLLGNGSRNYQLITGRADIGGNALASYVAVDQGGYFTHEFVIRDETSGDVQAQAVIAPSVNGGFQIFIGNASFNFDANGMAVYATPPVDTAGVGTIVVTASGTGTATAVATATAVGGSASIGPIATATTAEIQVNGLPLYTTDAAGPPGTFASLFYVDSTAVTGGTWLWDFVTAAYVRIAGVF